MWPITLPLVILLIASLESIIEKKRKWSKKIIYLLVYSALLPILIATIGSTFYDTDSKLAVRVIEILLLIELAYFLILIIKIKYFRLFIFSFVSLLMLLTLWITFVA